jgi:hypothetical protein
MLLLVQSLVTSPQHSEQLLCAEITSNEKISTAERDFVVPPPPKKRCMTPAEDAQLLHQVRFRDILHLLDVASPATVELFLVWRNNIAPLSLDRIAVECPADRGPRSVYWPEFALTVKRMGRKVWGLRKQDIEARRRLVPLKWQSSDHAHNVLTVNL